MIGPELDPSHALIIGAGAGLGAAIARRFGSEGFRVTVAARNTARMEMLVAELQAQGITADALIADAMDVQHFKRVLDGFATVAAPGVLIYNVALLQRDGLLTASAPDLADAYAVDVLGAVTAAQVFTPTMRRAHAGTLLLTGGGLSLSPHPAYASVSLGKAALRSAATMLHHELRNDDVHATGVTIAGAIKDGTPFAPHRIADVYWLLHQQAQRAWQPEFTFDGHTQVP